MSTSRGSGRRIIYQIFKNFIDSFSVRKNDHRGNFVGEDLFGNKFYENPIGRRIDKRLPRRSFEPREAMHFDVDNMSAEWDSWLRHKRKDPPTLEELKANMAIAAAKKINAKKMAEKDGKLLEEQKPTGLTNFPRYEEYEVNPGEGKIKFDPKE